MVGDEYELRYNAAGDSVFCEGCATEDVPVALFPDPRQTNMAVRAYFCRYCANTNLWYSRSNYSSREIGQTICQVANLLERTLTERISRRLSSGSR